MWNPDAGVDQKAKKIYIKPGFREVMRRMIYSVVLGSCLKMIGAIDMRWSDRSLPFISAAIAVKGFMPFGAKNPKECGVDYF